MKNILPAATLSGMLAIPLIAGTPGDGICAPEKTERSASQAAEYWRPMKADEPMPTGMAKPGMKKRDVEVSAEKKQTKMEQMMREEMK